MTSSIPTDSGSEILGLPDAEPLLEVEVDRVRAALESRMLRAQVHVNIGRFVILKQLGAGAMGRVYAAYDPELDRKVAVKLLHAGPTGAGSEGRMRLLREAQALAKLAHPNVVGVHEVGEHDDQVFVAMEFVEGKTLRQWWVNDEPSWRAILEHTVQAGRGLAAAHAAGLVHRDFKPDNVIVGDDGRVRVLDFGLARADEADLDETAETDALSHAVSASPMTLTGQLVGTPAYMAPEQLAGRRADAASDQFSFCVALWEGLFGARPFPGRTVGELAASVRDGRPVESSANVPRWLKRVLGRGLRSEVSERFSSMAELLGALERGRGRARARVALTVVGMVALLGVGVEGARRYRVAQAIDACEEAGATIDAVWNDAARTRVRTAVLATGVSYAETTAQKVIPWIDLRAEEWRKGTTDACLDVQVRDAWDGETLYRAESCFEERRLEIESAVSELTNANRDSVQRAIALASRLPSVAPCRDRDLLWRLPAPPPELSAQIEATRRVLAQAAASLRSGRNLDAIETLEASVVTADELGWPPLSALARHRLSHALGKQWKYAEAETHAEAAFFVASKSGAHDIAADVALELVWIVGNMQARIDDGVRWAKHADVAITALGEVDGARRALYYEQSCIVYIKARDRHAEMLDACRRAVDLKEHALGPDHPDLARNLSFLANAHLVVGEISTAADLAARSIRVREQGIGVRHPDYANSLAEEALVFEARGDFDSAVDAHVRAVEILEAALGPMNPKLFAALENLAYYQGLAGEHRGAKASIERGLRVMQAANPDDPRVIGIITASLARAHGKLGEYAEARALDEEALVLLRKAEGDESPQVGAVLGHLGRVQHAMGSTAEARDSWTRALAVMDAASPGDVMATAALLGLAELAVDDGNPQIAIDLAERALALQENRAPMTDSFDPPAAELAHARFVLARALWGDASRRARALALGRSAREGYASVKGFAAEIEAVDAWLNARAGSL